MSILSLIHSEYILVAKRSHSNGDVVRHLRFLNQLFCLLRVYKRSILRYRPSALDRLDPISFWHSSPRRNKGWFLLQLVGAAVAEWLSSWLAEQEDQGSIPGLATWIFRDWLSPHSKSRYGWKIAKSTLILKTTNQPTNQLQLDDFSCVYVDVGTFVIGLSQISPFYYWLENKVNIM